MATLAASRQSRARFFSSQMLARRANSILVFLTLLFLAVVVIGIPVGWVFLTALKDAKQIFAWPPNIFPDPIRWDNYTGVIESLPFLRFAANTLFIAVMNIIGRVLSCSLVAFTFARLRFPGRDFLFMLLLSTMMIPHQVTLIPTFALFQKLGWVGTYLPLIVPSFFGDAFFIFLMRQYIMTLPRDLDEAARIDGATTWDIFARIIMPLCIPPMVLITVLTFLWKWNDFLNPLIYISNYDDYTIQLGLNMLKGRFNIQWGMIMAGSLLAMSPCVIIYFLTQKYLIGGLANVGIKG
ncbi:MAG: carbohydrate ABC transporter permease [Chloroflexi bacterium]|nr:carbohydrate ABC transporter permease [Chloroflexota bacterium]